MAIDKKTENLVNRPPLSNDDQVRYLAENTDLSPHQARELVDKHGHDRKKLLELAKTMKAES